MVTTHYPHGMHLKKAFLEKSHARFVVDGGLLFASLYCTGWGLILCAIGVITSSGFQFSLLTGSICAVGQVLAPAAARPVLIDDHGMQALMCCSFLLYDSAHAGRPFSDTQVFTAFCTMTVNLALLGSAFTCLAGLCLLSPLAGSTIPAAPWQLLSLGSIKVIGAVLLTYGLGGHWRNQSDGWTFWQPFTGGKRFVAAQLISWFSLLLSAGIAIGTLLCLMGLLETDLSFCNSIPRTGWGVVAAGCSRHAGSAHNALFDHCFLQLSKWHILSQSHARQRHNGLHFA